MKLLSTVNKTINKIVYRAKTDSLQYFLDTQFTIRRRTKDVKTLFEKKL